jgi:prolipoprotein diacylglyceryltransferase
VPLHPTQTYSILWNIFTGVLLFRLWFIHCPLEIISGIYLILNGLGRFGEEAYRGEPQTPVRFGLRLYQWMAVLSVLTGILFTLSGTTVIRRDLTFQWALVPPALLLGAAMWCAYGVDFPLSNRRFARLT